MLTARAVTEPWETALELAEKIAEVLPAERAEEHLSVARSGLESARAVAKAIIADQALIENSLAVQGGFLTAGSVVLVPGVGRCEMRKNVRGQWYAVHLPPEDPRSDEAYERRMKRAAALMYR